MYLNSFLKTSTTNLQTRYIHTDNFYTYFTVSDFNDYFDGLWSGGFKIFSKIMPVENSKIDNKTNSPISTEINFYGRNSLRFFLFKKSEGFLIEFLDRGILPIRNKDNDLYLKIDTPFNVLENSTNKIIIEYTKPVREGFGFPKFYVALVPTGQYSITKSKASEDSLSIRVSDVENKKKECKILVLYDSDYHRLKKYIEHADNKVDMLKKQHIKNCLLPFRYSNFVTSNNVFNKGMMLNFLSAYSFVMHKKNKMGIWAGFQWFDNNWGRDTFISLSGISLVSGRYEEALRIIETFAEFQCLDKTSKDYGKIPNVIWGDNNILYNTADATPLFVREIYEYFLYTGDFNFIISWWNTIKLIIENCYIAKKDQNNFVTHEDSFDWMDAKKDGKYPFSPRGDKAVEIQVLWYVALYSAANIAKEIEKYGDINKMPLPDTLKISELKKDVKKYISEAEKLKDSFDKFFVTEENPYIYDHLDFDYKPDLEIRPNVLVAIYYQNLIDIPPLFDKKLVIKLTKFIMPKLVFKHGVASLDKNNSNFHPVHISEKFHKDAAYHNGSIWGFLSGIFINILCSYNLQDFAFKHTESLLFQTLNVGTIGSFSELVEPYIKKEIKPSGAYSQAWSVSEFCRSFYQDYMGVRFNVPKRTIYFTPAIPKKLGKVKLNIRFGFYETLSLLAQISQNTSFVSQIEIRTIEIVKPLYVILKINVGFEKLDQKYQYKFLILKICLKYNADSFKISFSNVNADLIKIEKFTSLNNTELVSIEEISEIFDEKLDSNLSFATPITDYEFSNYKSITEKNYLERNIIV
ncbi:MAG: hypothetical protein A2086_05590 [Spirochaetes bacterium GWD1_27_9]|nr:MAG: hypothetical protein A2086_05590 [Spirochaetes bacterium GWD1_27_9]